MKDKHTLYEIIKTVGWKQAAIDTIAFIVPGFILIFLRILPRRMALFIADNFGIGIAKILLTLKVRRALIATKGIEIAFPDLTKKEKSKVYCKSIGSMVMFFADLTRMGQIKKNYNKYIKVVGLENIERYKDSNYSFMSITAHVGFWEAIHMVTAKELEKSLKCVYRPSKNIYIERMLLNRVNIYKSSGLQPEMLTKKGAVQSIMQQTRKDEIVGIFADQRNSIGLSLPFFNKEAMASIVTQTISLRLGKDIVPIVSFRDKKDRTKFVVHFEEPILPQDAQGNTKDEKIKDLTIKTNKVFERWITDYPKQWMWVHDKWNIKKKLKELKEKSKK